jgi:hypothetical protein
LVFENLTRCAVGAKVDIMEAITHIKDVYSQPGFRACARVRHYPFDPEGLVVILKRRQKKRRAVAADALSEGSAIAGPTSSGIWTAAPGIYTWNSNTAASIVRGARP